MAVLCLHIYAHHTHTHTVLQFCPREGVNVFMSMFINVSVRRAMGG